MIVDGGSLPNWGYKLLKSAEYEEDFQFGRDTNILVRKYTESPTELIENMSQNPRANGKRFGREYYGGMILTFEGDIWTARNHPGDKEAALKERARFRAAWHPQELRDNPGKLTTLRLNRGNRKRRVYGRPGSFDPVDGRGSLGWIPYTATFRCVDHNYYDDAEYSEVIPFIAEESGGLVGPLIGPISSSDGGEASGLLTARGDKPSWLITRIYGPISDPVVVVQNRWAYHMPIALLADEFVTVDPTPWNRGVRKNNGAYLAGKFDSLSAPLSRQVIYPGPNSIALFGNDPTGTSKLEVFWRDTYSSY